MPPESSITITGELLGKISVLVTSSTIFLLSLLPIIRSAYLNTRSPRIIVQWTALSFVAAITAGIAGFQNHYFIWTSCAICQTIIGIQIACTSKVLNLLLNSINTSSSEEVKRFMLFISNFQKGKISRYSISSSLLLRTLIELHEPIGENCKSFTFIRRLTDFSRPEHEAELHRQIKTKIPITEYSGSDKKIQNIVEKYKGSKIIDFKTILSCIKHDWKTICYGDMQNLLDEKEYLLMHIEKGVGPNKIESKRILLFPYLSGNPTSLMKTKIDSLKLLKWGDFESILLKSLDLEIDHIVRFDKSLLFKANYDDFQIRTLIDLIYLIWLIEIHEHFNLDYRVISSMDCKGGSAVKKDLGALLSNWDDEGVALIDNSTVVRFKETVSNCTSPHVVYHFFEPDPETRDAFKSFFIDSWNCPTLPTNYTKTGLKELLQKFFNDSFVANILDSEIIKKSTDKWIQIIQRS